MNSTLNSLSFDVTTYAFYLLLQVYSDWETDRTFGCFAFTNTIF